MPFSVTPTVACIDYFASRVAALIIDALSLLSVSTGSDPAVLHVALF
jgi:hypothetical protein